MEVHHHSHTERKKFTHYLWEFLMLFLAVFCGFLAENFREHQVEKARAKQYVMSLYEDLRADTTRLNLIINRDDEKISGFKSIMGCYDTVLRNPQSTSCMGVLIKYSKTSYNFSLNDRTLRQLANAGGFRLLQREDADSILGYESQYKNYQNFESTLFQSSQDHVRYTLNELADFKVNAPLQKFALKGIDTMSGKLTGSLLFTDNKVLLNKWFNELALYLRAINGQRNLLDQLKDKATGLLQYYKTKHHFE